MTSDHCPGIARNELLSFALDHRPSARAAAHCEVCTPCRRLVTRLRASRAALRTLGGRRHVGPGGVRVAGAGGAEAERRVEALRESVARRILRGRILGAARDRAWADLGRRLRALARAADDPRADAARRGWCTGRDALRSLCTRLAGLGVLVDLEHLPEEPPAPGTRAWVDRHLAQLLDVVGRADPEPEDDGYQPSAAPSFLDSLAPR